MSLYKQIGIGLSEFLGGRILIYRIKRTRIYPIGIHWSHANERGGPVLREEVGFRNINGIWIGLPKMRIWLLFRRYRIKGRK